MKTIRLFTLIQFFVLLALSAPAQNWRWGVSGGSSYNHWIDNQTEYVVDMATDRNGNVYTITTVNNKDLNVAGIPKQGTTPSQPWQIDVMINSFNCSGQLRWSKVIGVDFSEDRGYALRTDSTDGVYAALVLGHGGQPSIRYMDADTLVHDTSYKQLWVVKYDTAGKFKWMDGPEQDTIGSMNAYDSEWIDMDVDGQGNVCCLVHLPANVYCGGQFTATTDGEYIVRYDKDGVFKSAIRLETNAFDSYTTYAHLARNPVTHGYYLYGSNYYKFYLPGDSVTNGMFILEFDNDGKYLWKKENTVHRGGGFFGRAAFDAAGNIYLAGNSTAGNSFDWYTTTNGSGYRTPCIVKLDKAGNLLWDPLESTCRHASLSIL